MQESKKPMQQRGEPREELYNSLFHYHAAVNVFSSDFRPIQGKFTMPGHCHLRVLRGKLQALVVATEIPTNPGKSVTNTVAYIATLAVKQFGLDPKQTLFIEHYTPESYEGHDDRETYDHVTFE